VETPLIERKCYEGLRVYYGLWQSTGQSSRGFDQISLALLSWRPSVVDSNISIGDDVKDLSLTTLVRIPY